MVKYKRVKHYHEPGDLHELTFSCYHRLPLLTNDAWCDYLAESIDKASRDHDMKLIAFVFMPEHVHLLVLPESQPNISRYLASIKRPCSVKVKSDLIASKSKLLDRLIVRERPGKMVFRFWQEGPGYDRNMQFEKSVLASIDYLHNNPVRRGLCRGATDWFWSSVRFYATDPPQQHPRLPKITPLPAEFLENVTVR